MTLSITSADIENMPPADRLRLISALWNSLTDADVPLLPAQRAELERRLDRFDAEAERAIPGPNSRPGTPPAMPDA